MLKFREANKDLISNHPSFSDKEYRNRREEINKIPIDTFEISYNQKETKTWKNVWEVISTLHQENACETYLDNMKILIENNIFSNNYIPQIKKVTDYLESKSGWKLYPVDGLLTPECFFSGLSKKIFYCTRYVRHHSAPFYTTEPDIIHEMIGHIPMFLDEKLSKFSEEIGKLAIENIVKIKMFERIYWNTVEFGLVKEKNKTIKAYGAGILSSVDEINKVIENKQMLKPFNFEEIINEEPIITNLQNHYYYIESFDEFNNIIKMIKML
jgi:phenylalanine-4-hydroxylase